MKKGQGSGTGHLFFFLHFVTHIQTSPTLFKLNLKKIIPWK